MLFINYKLLTPQVSQCILQKTMSNKTVLVIGGGPAGIAQLCVFAETPHTFTVVCFEQGSEMGGQWTYTEKVGNVHQSMYRNHQTNGLNEMLELPDYSFVEHFGHPITSYPPRAVMLDYIQGWAAKWKIDVTCNRRVIQVEYMKEPKKFRVVSENTLTGARMLDKFDYVIVATGHFSVPNDITFYPGMEDFNGIVIHSHNFRHAQDYTGKQLLVIGNGYSGEDIAMQCIKFGATTCTLCHKKNNGPTGLNFEHMNIKESSVPTHYDGSRGVFVFSDGHHEAFDAVIYCTGYTYSFPFLPADLALKTPNRLVPNTLWKGIVHPDNTCLLYLGMPDQYYTFSAFHAQGKFVRGIIEERIELPSKSKMNEDTTAWQTRENSIGNDHYKQHRLQYAHTEEAAALVGAHLRDDSALFDQWLNDRENNILTYRDQSAVSRVSGLTSLIHSLPWLDTFTDDKDAYLHWCSSQWKHKPRGSQSKL